MRVEVDNTTNEQYTLKALNQLTPQDIARSIAEKTVRPKITDVRKNIESFRKRKNNNVAKQKYKQEPFRIEPFKVEPLETISENNKMSDTIPHSHHN